MGNGTARHDGTAARWWALVRPRLALVFLLAVFLAARVRVWAYGTVFTSYDTFSYAYRGDPAYDRGPLVSFTGHSPRMWGAPVLYALFDGDRARAFAQWGIGTVAWAVLAAVLWRRLATLPARVLAGAAVLGLGLTPQVTSWDLAILSESLSISLGVLTLALLLQWSDPVARHRTAVLAALTVCGLWWTFTRPDTRVMTVVVTVAVAVVALVSWLTARAGSPAGDRSRWRGQRAPAVAVAVLVGAIVWASVITPTVDHTYVRWSASGMSLSEETLNYRLRLQVLPNPQIKAAYREDLGMPECPAADAVTKTPRYDIPRFAVAYRSCPALAAWGERNGSSSGYRFAVAAPRVYLRYTWDALPKSVAGQAITHTGTPVPSWAEHIAFPSDRRVLPALLGTLGAGLVAALLAGAWTRRRGLVVAAVAVAVTALGSIVAGLMYVVGVFERYGIQEAVALRIGIVLLFAAALDAALLRRAHRPGPATPTDPAA